MVMKIPVPLRYCSYKFLLKLRQYSCCWWKPWPCHAQQTLIVRGWNDHDVMAMVLVMMIATVVIMTSEIMRRHCEDDATFA